MTAFEDIEIEVLKILYDFGADPSMPMEARIFFENMYAAHQGTNSEFLDHIRQNAANWYRCVDERPDWIQGSDWPFNEGIPMVFVGHINVGEARFYLFWNPRNNATSTLNQTW